MSAVDPGKPDDKLAVGHSRNAVVQRASIAQLLLVARLRARNRRDLAVDSLERAAQVILVTCKSWFSSGPKNVEIKGATEVPLENKESSDAHRND